MNERELIHYGIKGMKWGVRRDGKQSAVKVRSGRLDTFGKDGHNILYVTGVSGSGKSTLAVNLAKKLDAEPVHLDWIYDGRSREKTPFSKFLENHGVNLQMVHKNGKLNYRESDKIFPLLKQYSKDRKLIVEGVQLLDDTMAVGISKELQREPVLSIRSNARVAFNRARDRDGVSADYSQFIKRANEQKIFENKVLLSIGEAYIDTLLSKQ